MIRPKSSVAIVAVVAVVQLGCALQSGPRNLRAIDALSRWCDDGYSDACKQLREEVRNGDKGLVQ